MMSATWATTPWLFASSSACQKCHASPLPAFFPAATYRYAVRTLTPARPKANFLGVPSRTALRIFFLAAAEIFGRLAGGVPIHAAMIPGTGRAGPGWGPAGPTVGGKRERTVEERSGPGVGAPRPR